MKNKLQSSLETLYCFAIKNTSEGANNSLNKNIKKTKIVTVLLFSFFLLFSSKGFAQLTENFDSGIPATWTIFGNGVGTQTWSTTTDGYSSTNGTSINPSADNIGDQNTAEYFLVTPQFAVPTNGEIHFYTKQSSAVDNGAEYEIRISTAAQPDINGFNIPLQTYTETTLNTGSQTTFEKKVIEIPTSIPAGLNVYIAFVAVNTQNGTTPTGDEWFVDDVSILEGCTEVLNADVTIDAITIEGAEVTWSHPTATNFELQVLPEGGIPAGAGIPVSGTTYTLMGLDEETSYDVYIRAICDNSTESEYSGPYNFQTLKLGLSCITPIVVPDISTTPYVLVDNLDDWTNPNEVYTTQGTNCIAGTSTTNYLNGNKIFLTYTPTQDGLVTLTQTVNVESGGGTDNCYNARSSIFVYDSCADVGVNCIAGGITDSNNPQKILPNILVTAGQTYVIVVSSELSTTAGICFSLEITSPTCAPPGDIVYNNLTEDSVSFSWDNIGGFADTWEYMVVPTGSGEPSTSGTPTSTNIDNVINTGLTAATTYDLYVRSICSGTQGTWSIPSTFTTQCTVFSTPYFTDFATATNTTPEPCWTTVDANNDGTTWAFIGGYATLQTKINNVTGISNDIYASPQVNFDGITQKRLRYKHRTTQGISSYSVRLSTTGVGVDDFTTIILPETQINNTSFSEIIVDIPPTIVGDVNIAFFVVPNTSETALRVSIDDVYIEDKPACPDPSGLNALNITTDSAWLIWTAGDTETQWEVAVQEEGSGIPTGNGDLTSSNFPYAANGLTPGTRYEYYVRAYCDATDQSEWIGPFEFITLCESYDTPFYESFNDEDPDTQKFCWKITDSNNDSNTWTINETQAELNAAVSYNDYLISPAINLNGTKELKYKYRAEFSFFTGSPGFGLEVLMSTTNTNPTSFSVISPLETFTNSDYQEKSLIIQETGTVYIAFRVPSTFTGNASILNIDDVSITDAPACPNPSDLIVETVLTDSADLSWTAGFQETSWNIVVQPEGSGIPTTSGDMVSNTNYSASGLMSNTEYEFYVMADCGTDNSQWVGPVTFSTLCDPFTTPFTETFNSDSTTENCWRVINNNDDLETWELDSGSLTYEGDQAAAMFTGTNGLNEDWLISPTITVTNNQRLRYYYRVYDSFFTEDLEVLLSTNGIGLDQFTTVLYDSATDPILINNVEYLVKIINLPAGITGDVNIAFHVPYYASTNSYRGQTLVIDNVNIEDIPNCPEPTNISLNNITDTEVQVAWNANGSETAWEISVQPTGTAAPVGDTDSAYLYNTSTNPFTVTGLNASTSYDIYVRAVCSGATEAEWTGPIEVITKCSFDNLCQYTFVLTSDADTSSALEISQNNQVTQSIQFNGVAGEVFPVFLCSGVEFTLYFDTIGSYAPQYANYQFEILNADGTSVYTSPLGLEPKTIVYEGFASCGPITCPEPTNLTISNTSVFSWTPGGSETQWEVAIQNIENGTIPQSGTIVTTNSYTPSATDFTDPNAATYEYFVRAVCSAGDESYWSGPFEFVRNDDVTNALNVPVNLDETCSMSITDVSFINTSVSTEAMSCIGTNTGDVWFSFVAQSKIHNIIANNYTGNFRESGGFPPYPDLVMTLYRENNTGGLDEITCSYDNVITAMYSSELIVGDTYKVRLTKVSTEDTQYRLSLCINTPQDLCFVDTVNGDFEEPTLQSLSGVGTIVTVNSVPGWRQNLDSTNGLFMWESLNAPGFEPYEGGQSVQILTDQGVVIDPNDPNIKGLYRDFDTSEITLFDFSYAHLARFDGNTIQVFAGPPSGPYVMINENLGITQGWSMVTGMFDVPAGQPLTRVIFRSKDNAIGNVIDVVNFVANNQIITQDFVVDCTNPIATIEAEGAGTWVPSATNPGAVTFNDATSSVASISDFVQPGLYTFTWQTRYCSYDLEVTYNGVGDVPTVQTPIEYCLNDTAQPLTATPNTNYTLTWYTQATGGTGSATALTPDTSIAGSTSYFVAYQDINGCEGPRAEIIVNINPAITPELAFSYAATCQIADTNPMPSLNTGFATGGTFTSTTLTVDATTGEVDIASATAGLHDIIYTYNGDVTTCTIAGTFTATIDFTAAVTPVTSFNYGTSPFCLLTGNSASPNLDANFATGGTYSSTTLTVNATTGDVDLTTAATGMHDIVYTYDGDVTNCIESGSFTTTIEMVSTIIPITTFTYSENFYCSNNANITPDLDANFTTGGVFSAETGLSINITTGEIDLSTSTTGNYTVSYTITEDIPNCTEANSSSFMISVLESSNPETTFDYGNDAFCLLTGNTVLPNLATGFTNGGVFSSTTVTVDANTGEIDLTTAATGMHDIVYTYNGDATNCIETGLFTTSIEVIAITPSITDFTYTDDVYCADSMNIMPELDTDFTVGGIFSAETGLSINPNTGEINVASSSLGNYDVTYQITEDLVNCIEGSVSTFNITILDTIEVVIEGECNGSDYILTALPDNNSFDPNDVTYSWSDSNGLISGENSDTFNVTNYTDQSTGFITPTQISVTINFGGCSTTQSYLVERSACRDIPKGISPDGNGKNDTLDLTGYGVTDIAIFNRYGKEVFSFTGNYTKQWYGQTNKGKELPVGTYFYKINKQDGTSSTGWIFINRAN
ncbi:choice-of-anchor J domain-containing protein [Olleya sp. R77988]|uniref:choice-of-anchor J domain-containing protein n=1 Tax=Olleya sp. R77988 TaxID=3093875 RepID=UPI0037CB5AC8